MKITISTTQALTLTAAILVALLTSASSQAADREDVVAGVVIGTAAGYLLAEHGHRLDINYRYSKYPDHHRRDEYHPRYHNHFHNRHAYGNYRHKGHRYARHCHEHLEQGRADRHSKIRQGRPASRDDYHRPRFTFHKRSHY